jgi:predicted metalloendopeptidase
MWVNKNWVSDVKIPPYKTHYGVSDQIEDCIMTTASRAIDKCVSGTLKGSGPEAIKVLHDSFVKGNIRNMDFLRYLIHDIRSIYSVEGILKHFAKLTRFRFPSVLQLQYSCHYDKKMRKILSIVPDFPSLDKGFFSNPTIFHGYERLLKSYGEILDIPGLDTVAHIEKSLANKLNNYLSIEAPICFGNGHTLLRKFRKIPWGTYFEELGITNWRKSMFEYNYPGFLRKLGVALQEVPLEKWKLYLCKVYIISIAEFLPPPLNSIYFKFKTLLGGETQPAPKMNIFINFIYDYLPDTFSPIFWNMCGNDSRIEECKELCKDLRNAARHRLKETSWLQPATRLAAIDKVNNMEFLIGKPDTWPIESIPQLSNVFLENVFILGDYSTQKMIDRVRENKTFWDQGIYRVNAYYYEPFNQITIPYGIISNPFYKDGKRAWNYGSIGFTIGHEMCHGFDNEGKEYDSFGKKKSWWTRADNRAYNKKASDIITLYEKQNIEGKHLDGVNVLGENIADIGGLGIALEALKHDMRKRGVEGDMEKEEFRDFFVSYAVGWRNLYRKQKLKSNIETDVHSPAYLRVNLVVSQFDEWYSAFDIQKESKLYIEEEKRIRFF